MMFLYVFGFPILIFFLVRRECNKLPKAVQNASSFESYVAASQARGETKEDLKVAKESAKALFGHKRFEAFFFAVST